MISLRPGSLRPKSVRIRLTLWYVGVLTVVLAVYLVVVYIFQYGLLTTQIYHDEIQDVETVEGLLYFDDHGALQLRQDYYSHPQSHLLIDRLMEVHDLAGNVLYRSDTLGAMVLGGTQKEDEGSSSFNERMVHLADGTHVLMISHRHPVAGRMLLIRLGYGLTPLAVRMQHFLLSLLLALPLALIVAGFAGYQIARRALAPLDSMAARAEQITASNLYGRLEIEDEDDELGRMARVLNSLLSRLERSFAQLQRFTADAAHELKTPLASIRAVGEGVLHDGESRGAYREAISSMLEETARLNQTVEGLLLISRAEAGEITLQVSTFPLKEVVAGIITLLDVVMEEKHIRLVQQNQLIAESLVVADRILLRTCILNVLHNALKFSPADSSVILTYDRIERGGRGFIRLSIQDHGPGISEQDRQRVFERFFRVREVRELAVQGAGLGLAIAKLAIESNGGDIYFEPNHENGALCHIEVPAHEL